MSRFLVINLFTNPIKDYHQTLVERLCEKFSVQPQKLPAHVTLIPPFESDDINELIVYTEHFARSHRRMPVEVGGIGAFRDNVVFLKVEIQPDDKVILEHYIETGKRMLLLESMPHVFHCTLLSRRISRKFAEIIGDLSHENHVFDSYIDNLSIMKWDETLNMWRLVHQFHLHP